MTSNYNRKTTRGISDYDALLNAIKAIIVDKRSIQSTAKTYDIKRQSLSRYVKKFNAAVPDIAGVPDDDLMIVVRRIASYATNKMVCPIFMKSHCITQCVICNLPNTNIFMDFYSFFLGFQRRAGKGSG